jgi:ribosomal protein S18 acetylase RimI-like enzyme
MTAALQIQQIDFTQAQLLSDLAKKIYIPHYPYLWNQGGIDWYINEFAYPVEKIKNELLDSNNLHFVAYLNREPIGYLKLNINPISKAFEPNSILELERIYILKTSIQKGIGTQLMNFVKEISRQLNKKTILLKAMDSATQALSFYEKNGFEIIGNFQLPADVFTFMKPEFRGMFILKHDL